MAATDTIVALSTPPGRSGIGVIRLSGSDALEFARLLVHDPKFTPQPNRSTLRSLWHPETREVLDHALVTYFKAPHSFTGEDVVELSCHGSPVILRSVVDVILRNDGRAAGPGEFTLRAMANGKLNLAQAEAVRDLINAQTDAAVQLAAKQLRGELAARLQTSKDLLLEVIVLLESSIEFVEDDLPAIAVAQVENKISNVVEDIKVLWSTYKSGKLIRDGLRVTLAGKPNVGKSSIFNKLLSSERAIVTDIPGTTRDSLSESISIKGIPILLTDTAGVRASADEIESLGVERTRRSIADSDLIVVVLDGSKEFTDEDRKIVDEVKDRKHIVVLNKRDLDSFDHVGNINGADRNGFVKLSAKTGQGLDNLLNAILAPFETGENEHSGILITDARHFDLLRRAQDSLEASLSLLKKRAGEELVLVGLHDGLRFLGEITGETTTEDILSRIFSTFCIGK
jgi:tRNA modification GTPase